MDLFINLNESLFDDSIQYLIVYPLMISKNHFFINNITL
jgi:hypothetical protein